MATTMKSLAAATRAQYPNEVERIQRTLTAGTTTRAEEVTVVYIEPQGRLALVSWPFGAKDVVVLSNLRNPTEAEREARRRLFNDKTFNLPNRLTGQALDEVALRIQAAGASWGATVAEEAKKLVAKRREDEAKTAQAASIYRRNTRVVEAWPKIEAALVALRDDPNQIDALRQMHPTTFHAVQTALKALKQIGEE